MRKIRDILRLVASMLLCWLYLPHLLSFMLIGEMKRELIISDLNKIEYQLGLKGLPKWLLLLDMLHNNRYYRVLFYHRIGAALAILMKWYRPGDKYFRIRSGMKIGEGMWIAHPYATILNAESIGNNFRCIHCTTIGAGKNGIPTIGDNVTIGAGSVVVKDIPDNCIAVGNPCKPIKYLGNETK